MWDTTWCGKACPLRRQCLAASGSSSTVKRRRGIDMSPEVCGPVRCPVPLRVRLRQREAVGRQLQGHGFCERKMERPPGGTCRQVE
eukprot:25422-Pleurochrysis_carterae.AAC.2